LATTAESNGQPTGYRVLATGEYSQVVYLNFDGGDAHDALGGGSRLLAVPRFESIDVSATVQTPRVNQVDTFEESIQRSKIINEIVRYVQSLYKDFNIKFTLVRPPGPEPKNGGNYTEVVIGGDSRPSVLPPSYGSVAVRGGGLTVVNYNVGVAAALLYNINGSVEPQSPAEEKANPGGTKK